VSERSWLRCYSTWQSPVWWGTGLNNDLEGTRHSGPPLGSRELLRLFGRISRTPKRASQVIIRVQVRVEGGIRELSWVKMQRSFFMASKAWYQAFFWVLIDLIIGFLGLIIKEFDNQTEIWAWLSSPLIIKLFEMLDDNHDYFVYKTFTHKARSKIYSFGQATWQTLCRSEPFFLQWKQECCICETTPCCHLLQLPAAPPSPIAELLPIDQRVLCDYHGSISL
jgi:hypothetical protein